MMTLQIVLWVVILSITLNYILLISFFAHGLNKLPKININNLQSQEELIFSRFSVIIAARNEENNILKCLNSLALQDYPNNLFEVIVVNDQSTDTTEQIINQFIETATINIKQLFTSGNGGKKEALSIGILASSGAKIITTDADCIVPFCWISEMNRWFQATDAVFITGPVSLQPQNGLFNTFQCLEFNSLLASTAGSIGQGMPIMSNGANMGFDLQAYHNILNNYSNNLNNISLPLKKSEQEHKYPDNDNIAFNTIAIQHNDLMRQNYASGDDIFMMLALKRYYGSNKIAFMNSPNAMVITETQPTLRDFLSQRTRWVSKSRGYSDWQVIYTAVSIFGFNSILLFSIFLALLQGITGIPSTPVIYYLLPAVTISLFATKTVTDAFLLSRYLKRFGQDKLVRFLLLIELPVSFYTVFIGVLGNFKSFQWKGRAVKRNKL